MSDCPRCGTVRLLPTMPTLDGRPVQMCSVCHRIDLKETWDERRDFAKMTTIDHQQAAIRAIAAALHGDACPADPDPGESCGCGDYEREAEIALTAATPHLRAETVDQLKNFRNDYQYTYAIPGDPYAEGYLTACKAIIALLEGGAE